MTVKLLWWCVRATGWKSSLWSLLETCRMGCLEKPPTEKCCSSEFAVNQTKGLPREAACCQMLLAALNCRVRSYILYKVVEAHQNQEEKDRPSSGRQVWLILCGISGSWCAQGFVWVLWTFLAGNEFDSKRNFTPPTVLLGLLLCPWMWVIFFFFFLVRSIILLLMIVQQRVVILEFLQKMSTSPSTPPSWYRNYFSDKGPSSKRWSFFSSHVWMWELDCEESWAVKNSCF